MDKARRVLARLERIEALDREHALPGELLAEVRQLLTEAEAWAMAERTVPQEAADALEQCRDLLSARKIGGNSSRTLLA